MDGGKGERRGGKSWRKEREERERKRTNNRGPGYNSKDADEKKDDPVRERHTSESRRQQEELEKRKAEEERKQKEEEEEAERVRQEEEELTFLLGYIQEAEERLARKAELRVQNLAVAKDRPELNTAMLDSSLKKNTAFIKKLKNLTESQHDSLIRDLQSLNLTKYVSEVAQAVVEAKLKMSDITTAVHLCSLLHQRYHDFASTLLENWQKVLSPKKDEKACRNTNMSKLRVDLRLYAELITAGIFAPKEGLPLLGNVLTTLVTSDKEEHQNISVLLTFCRHCGEDYMGLVPRKIRLLADQFQAEETPTEEVDDTLEEEELEVMETVEEDAEEVLPPELPPEEEQDDSLTGTGPSSNKVLLDAFLSALPNCINRDLIDSAAMEFCLRLNTKPSRKKLVRALFLVPRTRLDLLPFYSRLVATLQPLMPDLATDLVNMLRQDFKYQVRKKDQINIESKIKVVRFIGELVKFRVFPRSEALLCLRMLLQDFNHHHIEMACNLLETCGRFLYRIPDSHHRTKIYLEQMMRKKTVKAFDPRYNTMIENAYFYVNPPDTGPETTKKERPPMHQYIRKLLYNDLCKSNTEKILRQDWVGPAVVDGILEDIRLGLEVNHPKYNQRRVAAVKYLGELYNYRVIESTIIFKVLYLFCTFGVVFDQNMYSEYDPPEHLFRLRLVCTLLETCGQFFSSGSSKRRLDCFLHYYQYKKNLNVWNEEEEFPWQIEHLVRDTISAVRPKLQLSKSLEEAQKAVQHLNNQIMAKAIEVKCRLFIVTQIVTKAIDQVPSLRQYLQQEEESENLETITEEGVLTGDAEEEMGEDEGELLEGDMKVNVKHVDCEEDTDFMSAFDRMMADSLMERATTVSRPGQLDISVPVHVKSTAKKTYDQLLCESTEEETKPVVNFVLMTRAGNKQQYNSVEMPVNSELAERAEKEKVKRMTLEINERQEEEEAAEIMQQAQRPATMNFNRDRRPKYQHPKGAPDADLIFGPKKIR
ncbi:Regulator of nonsense transcripts 2-like [Homarus americanus]|uniref:Regulator of nonsense transcripts 2-like n=1 Tax=Homarus americanus TaxID=6706 RepID=A0A8J5NAL5_HOMAM|nr:Regulator of nonsense transcripts 2-like [Homarus americanus]